MARAWAKVAASHAPLSWRVRLRGVERDEQGVSHRRRVPPPQHAEEPGDLVAVARLDVMVPQDGEGRDAGIQQWGKRVQHGLLQQSGLAVGVDVVAQQSQGVEGPIARGAYQGGHRGVEFGRGVSNITDHGHPAPLVAQLRCRSQGRDIAVSTARLQLPASEAKEAPHAPTLPPGTDSDMPCGRAGSAEASLTSPRREDGRRAPAPEGVDR